MWTLIPIILICASTLPQQDCSEVTALDVFSAPVSDEGHAGGYVACLQLGMLYLANSNLLAQGTYPKIICAPPDSAMARRHGHRVKGRG